MKIKSITIEQYKSVKTPQTIEFGKGGIITLIGKNGSGKTNLLEAIEKVFQVNRHEDYYGYEDLKYSIVLELDETTLKELDEDFDYKPQDRIIRVYFDGLKHDTDALQVKFIQSTAYAKTLKESADAVKKQVPDLLNKLKEFRTLLKEINIETDGYLYTIKDIKDSQTCKVTSHYYYSDSYYNEQIKSLIGQVEEIVKSICHDEDKILSDGYDPYSYSPQTIVEFPEPDFRLVYREPTLTEFDKQFVRIENCSAIKTELEKVNQRISELSANVKESVKILNGKIKKFNNIIKQACAQDDKNYIRYQEQENKKQTFMTKVKTAIGKRCHVIPCDDLMFESNDRGNYSYRHSYRDLLIKTYVNLKFDAVDREKFFNEYNKNHSVEKALNNLGIDKDGFVKDFEAMLNKDLPLFDRDMITKIEVKYDGGLNLYLIEKNKDEVPFDHTSLGRRWYYTYYFIKNCLEPGDILILDEPGAFLHPQAQNELLRDLEELAKSNPVILCTHSPFMISEKYNNIHVVRMQNSGTAVSYINLKSLEKLKTETGLLEFNSVILNVVQEQIILCEGPTDKACIEAFMDYFKIDKNKYMLMQTTGWAHARPLIEFFLNNEVNLRVLLDKDSEKSISEGTAIKVPKYISNNESAKITDIPKKYLTLVFVGSDKEGGTQDIEGLFSEEDKKNYLVSVYRKGKNMQKVNKDIGEILPVKGVDQETENNFKRLFEELKILDDTSGKIS